MMSKLDEIAAKCHGYVGADLCSVCSEAAMQHVSIITIDNYPKILYQHLNI